MTEKDIIINSVKEGSTIVDYVVSTNSIDSGKTLKQSLSKANYPFDMISSSYEIYVEDVLVTEDDQIEDETEQS